MKELLIDMELLLELISEDTRGEGDSYLNLISGELSYIPRSIINALEDNTKISELEDWEKSLIDEASNILKLNSQDYLFVPIVEENFTLSVMKEYTLSIINTALKEKLLNSLKGQNYSYDFNAILLKEGDIDNFYDFKDYKYHEYAQKWLFKNGIQGTD
ncbi:hypothetical protein SDC9_62517 [bioreactor metagenome]|uniref:Uncharacterized protein n=1 Tax=bioreactor metagenome TaxID=1076179 RepID=A0A644XJZ3_9ZZZZ